MKKLLSILGVITVGATIPTTVVSCAPKQMKMEIPKAIIFENASSALQFNPSDLKELSNISDEYPDVYYPNGYTLHLELNSSFTFKIKNENFLFNAFIKANYIISNNNWHWFDRIVDNLKENFNNHLNEYRSIYNTKIGGNYNGDLRLSPYDIIPNDSGISVSQDNEKSYGFSLTNTDNNIVYGFGNW